MRIVFMGTPEFAVPALDSLRQAGYDIVGVVTATDKWGGRSGKELIQSAVKKYAVEHGLNVLQPEKLKNPEFIEQLRALQADLQVVVAFRMLPEIVWNMPPKGTINLHGSLLPKYRGAAPINWAIINGETETGLSTFLLKHEIDTGDMLFQVKTPIGADETMGELYERLMAMGGDLIVRTVRAIETNDYTPIPQLDALACPAPKIFHETCQIDWAKTCREVHNFVRGLSPHPAAWTRFDGQTVKIYKVTPCPAAHELPVGTIEANLQKNTLRVAVCDGFVEIDDLQMAGKKRLAKRDFLNGYKFQTLQIG